MVKKERLLTMQEKKAALFEDIRQRLEKHCDGCMLGPGGPECWDFECSVMDDWATAILSLDRENKKEWAEFFPENASWARNS